MKNFDLFFRKKKFKYTGKESNQLPPARQLEKKIFQTFKGAGNSW